MSRYQKVTPIWIFVQQETVIGTGSGISWVVYMQVCTSLQTDNHASTPLLSFLQAGCPSCRPTNSVKALKATSTEGILCHARLMQLMLLTPAEQVCQHNTARSCWSRHASTSARVDIACQRGDSSKPAVCRCCGAQWHRQTDRHHIVA